MRTVPIGAQGSFAMVVSQEHLANRFKDATDVAVITWWINIDSTANDTKMSDCPAK